ncbi:MAG: hypothetical protein ACRCV0_06305 [Brevinema sp.]
MKIIILYSYLLFFMVACEKNISVTQKWLVEYEEILQQSVLLDEQNDSTFFTLLDQQLLEKEKELDRILKKVSMQDKLVFFSSYYDLKLKYNYDPKR